ncbi:MAG: RagB/SusD family nutrient uptake outer membrane protein [Verrucomicrobiota bacterium]
MKKITYILILSILPLAYSGCTKLTEEPKGLMAPEGFFKTPEDVQAVIMGAYAEWNTTQIEKSFFLTLQLRSDMVDIGDVGTAAERIAINNFSMDANNSLISESWIRFYQSISAANTAIKAARQISADAKIKNELEARARFIRAFTYFHLVRCFGDVPYLDQPIESAEVLDAIGRTAESEVYKKIIEDLIFAKTNLPAKNTSDVRNIGTQGSAATVLADVYLTLKQFANAATEARFVINNAASFNYQLEKNFQDLFNANIETTGNLKEPVFTIDKKATLFLGGYDPVEGMVNLTRVKGLAARSLSVNVPSLKVYNSWDSRDYRRKVSFEDSVLIGGVKTALLKAPAAISIKRPHIAKYFRYTGPGPLVSGDDRSSDHHYCMYRFAEVILIAAEAIAESEGPTSEAIGYVNLIRTRARWNGTSLNAYPANLVSGMTKEELIKAVREERRLEFAFEFNRWYDLKRWGILEEAFASVDSYEPHTVLKTRDYLFPIPQTEINITDFSQNSGY